MKKTYRIGERPYTVGEIDALRQAVDMRFLFGDANGPQGTCWGRSYRSEEKAAVVEEQVRTFMVGGVTADDLRAEDKRLREERAKLCAEIT